jgi:hypothetical protein
MGYNHKANGNSLVLEGGMGVHINLTSRFGINQEIISEVIGISSKEKKMQHGNQAILFYRPSGLRLI